MVTFYEKIRVMRKVWAAMVAVKEIMREIQCWISVSFTVCVF